MIEFNLPLAFECDNTDRRTYHCNRGFIEKFNSFVGLIMTNGLCEKCSGTGKIQLEKLELDKIK